MKKREPTLTELRALHEGVDQRAARLEAIHASLIHCERGCHACCLDSLTVFTVEAERIRRSHGDLLENGTPHPAGACAFLGEAGECRIYADRPYVCRTQGLPLRWMEEDESGEIHERRDICPLNAEGMPLKIIAEESCWLIGPVELELGKLQDQFDGRMSGRPDDRPGERIALRSLFKRR
jgi:Fe-S-cluster containining protein